MKIDIRERVFHFRQPATTSRGTYTQRRSWLLTATDGQRRGVGECAPLPDLSCDAISNYADVLASFCRQTEQTGTIDYEALRPYPSMLFGLETALLSLNNPQLFDTPFTRQEEGITINGLVWMGSHQQMLERIEEKLRQGFHCIKLKVGAISFEQELSLVAHIRQRYGPRQVQLRLDANGGFHFAGGEALYRLELLSQYAIHSIEQPIRQGQWANMAQLCRESPLPIALDEELIGVNTPESKRQMLNIVKPQYIVLKPSLHGGMAGCREWIQVATDMGIGWWLTSALESNIGLNAIARFCSTLNPQMPQGLGTGQLYTDNIPMPLYIKGEKLYIR